MNFSPYDIYNDIALVFDVYILIASKWSKKLEEFNFAPSKSTKNSWKTLLIKSEKRNLTSLSGFGFSSK